MEKKLFFLNSTHQHISSKISDITNLCVSPENNSQMIIFLLKNSRVSNIIFKSFNH